MPALPGYMIVVVVPGLSSLSLISLMSKEELNLFFSTLFMPKEKKRCVCVGARSYSLEKE
jgi:hypothetical protein